MAEQLLLIPLSPEKKMETEFLELKCSTEKVRRGLFAKHSELKKNYDELRYEFELLKRDLCRNGTEKTA